MKKRRIKAQSTAEYAVLLGVVIAAVLAMQTYVKRGVQGRFKDATDVVSTAGKSVEMQGLSKLNTDIGQYEPYYLRQKSSTTESNSYGESGAVLKDGGARMSYSRVDSGSKSKSTEPETVEQPD